MAGKHRTAISLVVYLVVFAIALRFYFHGRHMLAFVIVFSTWAVLSARLYFSDSN